VNLPTKILLGLVLGALAGGLARALAPGAEWVEWVARNLADPIGQVFLRLLLMTVVPLVFASVALGVANLGGVSRVGRIGGLTLLYFVITSSIAVLLGLLLANVFEPGASIPAEKRAELAALYAAPSGSEGAAPASFGVALFLDIVPKNAVKAMAEGQLLSVLFFALVFGLALGSLPHERTASLRQALEGLGEVITKIIEFAMKLAPYGVFGLIFAVTARFGWDWLGQLGYFVAVVLGGLLFHAAVVLSLLVRTLGGRSPLEFWRRSRAVIVTAFSTSSSSATLPTTMRVARDELGLREATTGFVLPLGATMNMNGTALFEGVTILFLAQVFGVELSLGTQVFVLLLAVITAIGAAGVPGGSIPMMMGVLGLIGVPAEAIAIVLGVDRILDMCRTTVNVVGDLAAATFVDRVVGGEPGRG
jgi:DAACS family dicarboxylate/amino acid:cation (Na+ or H+) symporter